MASEKKKSDDIVYSYRGGKKVALQKRPDEFVIRRLPGDLPTPMSNAEVMSSASSPLTRRGRSLRQVSETKAAMATSRQKNT